MNYLSPKAWFGVKLTHAPADKQPRRGTTTLVEQLKARCPTLANPAQASYVPSWLLPQGDIQTIYLYTQHFKPADCPVEYEREVFVFEDGGRAAVDWARPRRHPEAGAPLVILVPGTAGTSFDYYARSFIHCLAKQLPGCQAVVLQSRGCNGVDLVTPKGFHCGHTDDLREFVAHISKRMPDVPLVGIGFSLGANILTKYVGEEGDGCRFVAAASVCNPFDIDMTVRSLCAPSLRNRCLYGAALTRSLVSLFASNEKVIMASDLGLDADSIRAARNISEFNDKYTAKVFGYESAKDMHVRGSSTRFLKSIKIPMLFINALDDPMCCRQAIPFAEIESNPNLVLAVTRYGGHLAFFEGSRLTPWLPRQLVRFIDAMLTW